MWIVIGLCSFHRIWKLRGKRVKKTKRNVKKIDEWQSLSLKWIFSVFSLKLFLQFHENEGIYMCVYIYSVGEERKKTPKSSYQIIARVTRELAKLRECLTQQTFELHSCAPHVTFHKLKKSWANHEQAMKYLVLSSSSPKSRLNLLQLIPHEYR